MEDKSKRTRQKAGYEASYDDAVSDLEDFNKNTCKRLAKQWSDVPEKAGKAKCPMCKKATGVKKYGVNRTITTRFGKVNVTRNYHFCTCGHGFYPKDIELGFDDDNLSQDVSKWALDLLLTDTFEASCERLELHHDIRLSATKLLHFFQRKSSPLADCDKPLPPLKLPIKDENSDTPVMIQVDGSMIRQTDGWHEVKLMSIESLGDCERLYLADSTDKDRFEAQLRESQNYSKLAEKEVLWICDGARWIWKMQDRLCPHAYQLLDYYHATEHAHDAAKALFGEGDSCTELFANRISCLLIGSEIELLFDELKECIPYKPRSKFKKLVAEILLSLLYYYGENRHRLNYKYFRKRGWPIGSGAIESSHKFVLQKRMKLSGMQWTAKNVQRMATLRALRTSIGAKHFADTLEMANQMAA